MLGKVLASAVLGLCLVGACASETPQTGPRIGSPPPPPAGSTPRPPTTGTMTPGLGGAGLGGPSLGNFGNPTGLMSIAGGAPISTSGTGAMAPEDCGSGDFIGGRVTPVVWLVIDGSGSMAESLVAPADPTTMPAAGASRWDSLRPALMDPNGGVVKTLDPLVKFGMVMFDGPLNGGAGTTQTLPDGGPATGMPPTDECPRLALVEPALNNFAVLDMAIPTLPPGGSTPTHKAMEQVLSHLPADLQVPDQVHDPVYVVLATDGAPNDFCAGGGLNPFQMGPDPIQQMVVSLTGQMQMKGVPVYVISLAAGDQRLATHLADVAKAGGTGKPPFTPQDKDALVQTFMDIIGPEVLCSVKLTQGWGVMPQNACMGKVALNGKQLDCNSDNGWKLSDSKTIEITGTACDEFKKTTNVRLTAFFPCEIQVAM